MFVVQRTFRRVRRGYDPDEVDRHLELVSRWFASTEVGVALADERARLAEREHVLAQREKELRRSVEGTRLEAEATLEGARARADATMREAEAALEGARLEALASDIVSAAQARADA
ncbi:MAG TPA: DivIVA domain-containing protein, partial [Solirubrobacteraceae bacterium]|nr:DivIVA domain-containing protein [Solirubrobacteraceae bacterium]